MERVELEKGQQLVTVGPKKAVGWALTGDGGRGEGSGRATVHCTAEEAGKGSITGECRMEDGRVKDNG